MVGFLKEIVRIFTIRSRYYISTKKVVKRVNAAIENEKLAALYDSGACRYAYEDAFGSKLMCAVGATLPKSLLSYIEDDEILNGCSIDTLIGRLRDRGIELEFQNADMVRKLQRTHDKALGLGIGSTIKQKHLARLKEILATGE